jgi:putative holliday junction resolvase
MYLMGFDYGSKRIGVAVGQRLTGTARPLAIVPVKDEQIGWTQITALVQEWQPEAMVVGLPKYADGSDNTITAAVRDFCQQLQERYQLPVHTIDETLSSVAAAEQMKEERMRENNLKGKPKGQRKKRLRSSNTFPVSPPLDAVAAQIILETWFTECL